MPEKLSEKGDLSLYTVVVSTQKYYKNLSLKKIYLKLYISGKEPEGELITIYFKTITIRI